MAEVPACRGVVADERGMEVEIGEIKEVVVWGAGSRGVEAADEGVEAISLRMDSAEGTSLGVETVEDETEASLGVETVEDGTEASLGVVTVDETEASLGVETAEEEPEASLGVETVEERAEEEGIPLGEGITEATEATSRGVLAADVALVAALGVEAIEEGMVVSLGVRAESVMLSPSRSRGEVGVVEVVEVAGS